MSAPRTRPRSRPARRATRAPWRLAGVIAGLLAAILPHHLHAQRRSEPFVSLDGDVIQFTRGPPCAKTRVVFGLQSAAEGPVSIAAVVPSCGLTDAVATPTHLNPGEVTVVSVAVRPSLTGGGRLHEEVAIVLDDGSRFSVPLEGHVGACAEVESDFPVLGEYVIESAPRIEGEMIFHWRARDRGHVDLVSATQILHVTVEEASEQTTRVRAVVGEPNRIGPFAARITLQWEEEMLVIPVFWQARSAHVAVAPEHLTFPSAMIGIPVEKTVPLHLDPPSLRPIVTSSSPWIDARFEGHARGDGEWHLKVCATAPETGLFEGRLTIRVEGFDGGATREYVLPVTLMAAAARVQ